MATVYMTVFGKQGLRELAEQNLAKAHYLAKQLEKRGASLAFSGPFFNEFVVRPANAAPAAINRRALESKIVGGLELGRYYPELDDCLPRLRDGDEPAGRNGDVRGEVCGVVCREFP